MFPSPLKARGSSKKNTAVQAVFFYSAGSLVAAKSKAGAYNCHNLTVVVIYKHKPEGGIQMGSIMKNKSHWEKTAILAIISCLALAGIAATVSASPASHRQTAFELVEITTKSIFEETVLLFESMLQHQFAEAFKDLPPDKKAAADAVQREITEWFREFFSWEQVRELYADIYMEVFTEEEMRELIRFYRSPLGQKVLAKTPDLMQISLEKTEALLYREIPKLQERLERKVKELE